MHRRRFAALGLAALTAPLTTVTDASALPPPPGNPRLYGKAVRAFPTDIKAMALTFNAAWNTKGIAAVLCILREQQVPAAFFPTGDFAERHPDAVRALAQDHVIGNHSHTHPHFPRLTRQAQLHEIRAAEQAIAEATGLPPTPFFRFPYGQYDRDSLRNVNDAGKIALEWVTDTRGYKGPEGGQSTAGVLRQALRHLRPGAILQMHVGTYGTTGGPLDVAALPQLIDAVRSAGFGFIDPRDTLAPPYTIHPHP
ncbi:polysaccharide deacetylase family protein [Streptomyces sp. T-3]|nr:polysaccharide deacetylase family protein [Streptomyces sp. T-3]